MLLEKINLLNRFPEQSSNLTLLSYMIIRSLIIYLTGLIFVRFNRKFMGLRNPFNFIVFVMIGSLSAAAIVTIEPFWPTLLTIIFAFFFNTLISYLVAHFPQIEKIISGPPILLIKDGKVKWKILKDNYITRTELRSELQEQLKTNDFSQIKAAYLASDGDINFVTKKTRKK